MYQGKRFAGIIPARGGSKGILKKNIKLCQGKPLIGYTADAVHESQYLDACIVSTDNDEIADVARACGLEVPFIRPAELSTDTAKGIDVMIHAFQWLLEHKGVFDYCMLLQPTSPLRTARDIDACIEMAVSHDADSVMSMYRLVDFSLPKLKLIRDNRIYPLVEDEGKTTQQRNNAEPMYKRNCAIYLTKKDVLLSGDLFGEKQFGYVMPEHDSVDINEPFDFELAEYLLSKRAL